MTSLLLGLRRRTELKTDDISSTVLHDDATLTHPAASSTSRPDKTEVTAAEKGRHRNCAKANNGRRDVPSFSGKVGFSAARTFYPQLLLPPLTISNF
jgi:hypothetical protein